MARPSKDPPVSREILANLLETHSHREIAQICGVTHSAVAYWVWKYSLPNPLSKSGRWSKWTVDETFFDVIDTQEKAYILGLIITDGHLDPKNHSLVIQLMEVDTHILEEINRIMKSNRPLVRFEHKISNFPNTKPQVKLVVQSIYLEKSLNQASIPSGNKTFSARFPSLPQSLIPHFIRGVWDGDGWIGDYQGRLSGNRDLLVGVQEETFKSIGVSLKDPYPSRNIYSLDIFRRTGKPFFQWIYKDASIYLVRKYSVFKEHWS